jgi:hypothetical protein
MGTRTGSFMGDQPRACFMGQLSIHKLHCWKSLLILAAKDPNLKKGQSQKRLQSSIRSMLCSTKFIHHLLSTYWQPSTKLVLEIKMRQWGLGTWLMEDSLLSKCKALSLISSTTPSPKDRQWACPISSIPSNKWSLNTAFYLKKKKKKQTEDDNHIFTYVCKR